MTTSEPTSTGEDGTGTEPSTVDVPITPTAALTGVIARPVASLRFGITMALSATRPLPKLSDQLMM